MKLSSALSALVLGAAMPQIALGDLIISGYIEGSSFNKYLRFSALAEIPAGGLSDYTVEIYFNGNTEPNFEVPLDSNTEALAACDSYVLADDGAALEGANPDQTSSSSFFNGDDAIVLKKNGEVVDSIGTIGVDPGSEWSGDDVGFQNESVCRIAGAVGDTDPFDVFDPSSDWIGFPENTYFSDFNDDRCLCPPPPPPPTQAPVPEDVFIHDIQGSEDWSPLEGEFVRVEAIVVGDFQDGDDDEARNLGGFYIQEEDEDADDDLTTSEGLFVTASDFGVDLGDVNLGDRVQVVGIVQVRFGQTQINAESVEITGTSMGLPTSSVVTLPTNLEAYEGMLVSFSQDLTIIEQFQLDRFSEVRLIPGDRPYQFTQLNEPDVTAFEDYIADLESKWIVYEDGRDGSTNDVTPFDGFAPYTTATAPRMGDFISNLNGVLTYGFGEFRVRSAVDGSNEVTTGNPRPKKPPTVGGNLRISSFNVLNFFTTLSGGTGPSGQSPRGADNDLEFQRQLQKLTTALVELDADIVGLVELENDFTGVLEVLVAAVNERIGKDEYAFVDPGRQFVDTSDVISVGFIYKPLRASVIGAPAVLDDSILPSLGMSGPIFDGRSTNRASLAVTFESLGGKQCLTIVNNHFKSKGGRGSGEDADKGDGQGNWNFRRTKAAEAVVEWLKTSPTEIECELEAIMGDLNAYAKEDPVQALLSAGYINVEPDDAYSFVFDGQIGTLDYILLNDALNAKMKGAGVWHINEDEADALDYNFDFGRPKTFFDGSVPFRSSDHSPVLVGLDLGQRRLGQKL